jgi:hypothetical protein
MPKKAKTFKGMDTKNLECRVLMHAWEHKQTFLTKEGRVELLELRLECLRCPTVRIDVYLRSKGVLDSRQYRHPDNYLVEELKSWGGRKIFNNNIRIELFSRYIKGAKRH